jgi:uncharacterized membrane protein
MPLVNRTHKGLLDTLFGKTSVFGALATAPTVYVGLSTTTPTMAGGNVTEPSGNNYARVATAAGDWVTATSADPSLLENANAVTFPQASGSWGTCTHFVLFDAASSGNVLGWGALSVNKTPTAGDTPSFPAASLDVTMGS